MNYDMATGCLCAAWAVAGTATPRFVVGDRVAMAGRGELRGEIIERRSVRAESQEWRVKWDNGMYGAYRSAELELSV